MRCYLVTHPRAKRYVATNADARATREELVTFYGGKKKDVEIDQVEVPLAKAELLDFINNMIKADDK